MTQCQLLTIENGIGVLPDPVAQKDHLGTIDLHLPCQMKVTEQIVAHLGVLAVMLGDKAL